MSNGVFIIVDDDFDHPLYASPDSEEIDGDLFGAVCERITEVLEDDGASSGEELHGEVRYAWRTHLGSGLSFVAFADGIAPNRLGRYLRSVAERYFDEVDDVRSPDSAGVEDVVIDVIPPWEETEDDED